MRAFFEVNCGRPVYHIFPAEIKNRVWQRGAVDGLYGSISKDQYQAYVWLFLQYKWENINWARPRLMDLVYPKAAATVSEFKLLWNKIEKDSALWQILYPYGWINRFQWTTEKYRRPNGTYLYGGLQFFESPHTTESTHNTALVYPTEMTYFGTIDSCQS